MEGFLYDTDEVPEYDPMEAYDMSVQAEPTITLNLVPADAAGTTFNLTPVLNSSSGEQYAPPPASSAPHTPGLGFSPSPLHLETDYQRLQQLQLQQQQRDATFHPPGHSPRGYSVPPPLQSPPYGGNNGGRFLPQGYSHPGALISPQPHHHQQDIVAQAAASERPFQSAVGGPEFSAAHLLPHLNDPRLVAAAQPPPSYQEYMLQQHQQQQLGPTADPRLLVAGEASSQQLEQRLLAKQLPGDRTLFYRTPPEAAANQYLASKGQILPHPPPPPPPYQGAITPKKNPPTTQSEAVANLDFASIPGVNLRKANVDLAVYVASLVPFAHAHFANIDNFAERCLACIVRKIRSNLPTLYTLLRVIRHSPGDPDPGCVLVPRTKDSRITVARPPGASGNGGGSKKIHPHLALVQIFRHPPAQSPAHLLPSSLCSHPFLATTAGEEGDGLMCISPLHYVLVDNPSRSPGAARRSPTKPQQQQARQQNTLRAKPSAKDVVSKMADLEQEDSDSDFISDSDDDDGIDWEERWKTQAVAPQCDEVQLIDEESLLKEITFLKLKPATSNSTATTKEPVRQNILERLKIMDDLRCLFKGKYDLDSITKLNTAKGPRSKTRKYLARQRHRESVVVGGREGEAEAEMVDPVAAAPPPPPQQQEGTPCEEKREVVIQDLFKETFDTDLDMELDSFSQDESEFVAQEFSIAHTFSMTGFGEEDLPGLQAVEKGRGTVVAAGSSDAMFGGGDSADDDEEPYEEEEGGGAGEEEESGGGLPCIVSSWSVAGGAEGHDDSGFLMFDPPGL